MELLLLLALIGQILWLYVLLKSESEYLPKIKVTNSKKKVIARMEENEHFKTIYTPDGLRELGFYFFESNTTHSLSGFYADGYALYSLIGVKQPRKIEKEIIIKAAVIFFVYLYFWDNINAWSATFSLFCHALGIGLPFSVLLFYLYHYINNKKIPPAIYRVPGLDQFINKELDAILESQKKPEQPESLLTSAQIEQLNELRSKIAITEARQFPQIRLSGANMPNLVPGAGMFTAKIKRHGEIQNLVVMLATLNAVYEFEKLYYSSGCQSQDFWAEGHLLPSRKDICYTILFVTAFRFNGRRITF